LWLKATVERERRERTGSRKLRIEGLFLVIFGPEFLLLKAINSASIYRRWKRVISSAPG
jgi:hypothetical protein